jgi:hypothetical protein
MQLAACSPLPAKEKAMAYRIAGIDVHKKVLAVVVADVECAGGYEFERRRFGSNPEHLQLLAKWLLEQEVEEVGWNPRHNTGNRFGEHWNATGGRLARSGKVLARCQESCIWRKRNPIADGEDGRRIFRMPSDW